MDIGRSTSAHAEYAVGHDKLTEWGSWIRSTRSPLPMILPHLQPMFRDMEQRYTEETFVRESYNPDEAELCHRLIRMIYRENERQQIVLHMAYPMRLSKIEAASRLSRMEPEWKCNRHVYGGWLDQAVAVVDAAYRNLDFFTQ
jgi:hypothetical protein